jgi:hypothetical protein
MCVSVTPGTHMTLLRFADLTQSLGSYFFHATAGRVKSHSPVSILEKIWNCPSARELAIIGDVLNLSRLMKISEVHWLQLETG